MRSVCRHLYAFKLTTPKALNMLSSLYTVNKAGDRIELERPLIVVTVQHSYGNPTWPDYERRTVCYSPHELTPDWSRPLGADRLEFSN